MNIVPNICISSILYFQLVPYMRSQSDDIDDTPHRMFPTLKVTTHDVPRIHRIDTITYTLYPKYVYKVVHCQLLQALWAGSWGS